MSTTIQACAHTNKQTNSEHCLTSEAAFLGFMSGMEWGTAVAKCPGGID